MLLKMLRSGLVVLPHPISPHPAPWPCLPGNSSAGSDGNRQGVLSHRLGAGESVQWGVRWHEFPSHGQGLHHADPEPDGFFGSSAAAS